MVCCLSLRQQVVHGVIVLVGPYHTSKLNIDASHKQVAINSTTALFACGWLLQLELEPHRIGAVYVKPRHLISDLVSLDTASMCKGNRGALEAFVMLMRYKIDKLT